MLFKRHRWGLGLPTLSIIHINNDMNINIHIDINMSIDIHIIININIESSITYYLIPIGYSQLTQGSIARRWRASNSTQGPIAGGRQVPHLY